MSEDKNKVTFTSAEVTSVDDALGRIQKLRGDLLFNTSGFEDKLTAENQTHYVMANAYLSLAESSMQLAGMER